MNEQEIREQICDVCHKMWQQGWVAANDGNVSVKIGEDLYLATPTGISKSFITPEKLIKINGQRRGAGSAGGLPAEQRNQDAPALLSESARMSARSFTRIRPPRPGLPARTCRWTITR